MRTVVLVLCVMLCSPLLRAQDVSPEWLAGTWILQTGSGRLVETWRALNDSTFIGVSIFVRAGADSVLQEKMLLSRQNIQWTFTSRVTGQNNNQPVAFPVIFMGDQEFICENPNHDFPQRIGYRRLDDKLLAFIEGRNKGVFRKKNFDFAKNPN